MGYSVTSQPCCRENRKGLAVFFLGLEDTPINATRLGLNNASEKRTTDSGLLIFG
jgi:hypothetical protein